jgi:hypothetical protein
VRAGAAEQHLPRRGVVEGCGVVGHRTVDEPGLAAVADAGATRPVGGHVARLGELEQAAVALVPWDRERRAAERDLGALTRWPGGWVGLEGVLAWFGAEHLTVQPPGLDAPTQQGRGQLTQESGGAAQVEVGVARNAQPQQGVEIDPAGLVEVQALAVFGPGRL